MKAYVVEPPKLLYMLRHLDGTRLIRLDGLPRDAALLGIKMEPDGKQVWTVGSAEFLAVPVGSNMPIGEITVKVLAENLLPRPDEVPKLRIVES